MNKIPYRKKVPTHKGNPLAEFMWDYMQKHQYSNKELAHVLKMYPSTVSRILSGESMPLAHAFAQICRRLRLPLVETESLLFLMSQYYESRSEIAIKS